MKKKIVLTGGGTAGHVSPNIALMPELRKRGYTIEYIGSKKGIERGMIAKQNIPFHVIATGKIRRYFDLQNVADIFRVALGCFQAFFKLLAIRPNVIFSKGGFVAVPVVLSAKVLGIPVIAHESDMTPGLANKISGPSAKKICCTFPETLKNLPEGKGVYTGSPIRMELLEGDRMKGLAFAGLAPDKPVITIMGGSQGAAAVNDAVRGILPKLLEKYQVIHLCGKGKIDEKLLGTKGYAQFEFVSDELPDVFAATDMMISRAGANAICEFAALGIPMVLIPLSKTQSRGDQILNAQSFEKQGFAKTMQEEDITEAGLYALIEEVYADRETYKANLQKFDMKQSIKTIVDLIDANAKK